jgi:Carboxypeptidase regulatory-like domain/TonB dependent receptor
MIGSRFQRRCAGLLALASLCGAARAQVLYGSLTGNVADPSGAAVAGAKVEALNVATGVSRQGESDVRGIYLFRDLQAGTYKVTTQATGFQTVVTDNVVVNANEVRRIDFNLTISQATQGVEVSAASAILQTDKADVHAEITSQEIVELPYNGGEGKDFQSLLYLVPGAEAIATREANSAAGNPVRAQVLFMNGVSSQGVSTKIDGATDAYPWLPVNVAYIPPTEAIETVNISTNDFDAEQGAAGSAAVNVLIKSGTNQLHGSAYERNQNNDMTAKGYFTEASPIVKNIFNQYGFTLGGPIWIPKIVHGKNKLFFFLDYQGTKQRQYGSDVNLTLPTDAMRQGNFNGTGITVYDPLTGNPNGTGRQPFPNDTIPANRIDPAAVTLTGLLPQLTRPSEYVDNYDAYGDVSYNRSSWDYKVNYNPTSRAMVWGRYSFSPIDIPGTFALGKAEGDAIGGAQPGVAGGLVQTTAAGFTYTITPTLLLDANVGYTRQHIGANGDENQGDYGLNVLHIPGTNGVGPNYAGIPGFQVADLANIGNTNTGSPFDFRDNQYTTAFNIGKVSGSHNLRWGFEYDKYALNQFQPQGGTFGTARGTFGFNGYLTALCYAGSAATGLCTSGQTPNNNGTPANSWAQFLLGYPSELGKITQFQNPNSLRFSDWGIYARDQWQVTRKLTINYGLRWEYYPIFSHNWYGATRYDPTTYQELIGGEGGIPWDTGATASKKDFAPRFGVAYRLTENTVIRSGYGITIDPDNMRNQRNAFPSVINQDYNNGVVNLYQFDTTPGIAQASLRTGIPAPVYPNIFAGVIGPSTTPSPDTYTPSTTMITFPAYFNRGYIQSWNFFVQHEFSPTLTVEAGYVGTHAVHMDMGVNINGSAPGTGAAGDQLYPYLTTNLNDYEPFGDMTYNALQTRMQKRIGASVIGVAYTFSKALDNINGDNNDGTLFRTYPVSYALDKAISGFDRTHTFVLFHVYQLPFGKGHHWLSTGAASKIFGGFQIGGTLSKFSGLPFTVGSSTSCNCQGQTQTATQIDPVVQILGGHDPNDPYFNGAAFANPATGTLGTTGRDLLFGPGFFDLDENVSRTFSFKEGKIKLQIVGEAFNLTNTPSFADPGGTGASPSTTFATPTLNPNGTVKSYGGYSVITNVINPEAGLGGARQLQVSGYVRF